MDTTTPKGGNFLLVASWFGTSLTCFLFSLTFLFYLSNPRVALPKNTTYQLYSALPQNQSKTQDGITSQDARAKLLENFFKDYKSSLTSETDLFVKTADKYQLDFRLLPSIAMQESNGGRRVISNSYNPFGFGIYGSKVIKFSSWEEAIETVGRALRENYLDEGLHTPEQIMTKYTPPSLAKGGAWAKGVRSFMEELR